MTDREFQDIRNFLDWLAADIKPGDMSESVIRGAAELFERLEKLED